MHIVLVVLLLVIMVLGVSVVDFFFDKFVEGNTHLFEVNSYFDTVII